MSPPLSTVPDLDAAALRGGVTGEMCARIVAAHGPLVRAACRRILRDDGLSEDAVQETFVLLVRKARTLPAHTPLAGWLYHAACRTALNHLRTAMRRHAREASPEARASLAPAVADDLWREVEPQLDAAMLTLPERQRDLVVQCYFEDRSQRDAARALGCSESVVSRELSAAIEGLRRFFAERGVKVGGSALVAVLSANAARGVAVAGSAKLVAAMLAAAPGAAAVSFATLLAALAKMSATKIAGAAALVLAVSAVGYELASPHSRLAQLFLGRENSTASAPLAALSHASTPPAAPPAVSREAAARQAATLLATVPRFADAGTLEAAMLEAILCRDLDAQLTLLQRMGVTLSREALETVVQGRYWWTNAVNPTNMSRYSPADAARFMSSLFNDLLEAWARESPQAVLVWMLAQPAQALFQSGGGDLLPMLCAAAGDGRIAPALWDALLAEAQPGSAAEFIAAYQQMTDDPVAFLKNARQNLAPRDPLSSLRWTALSEALKSDPAAVLALAVGTEDKAIRQDLITRVAFAVEKTAAVRTLASRFLGDRPREANLFRVLGGDRTASIPEAIEHFANQRSSLYRSWAEADTDAAVAHALLRGHDGQLDNILRHGINTAFPEERLAAWVAAISPERQAAAWEVYYRLHGLVEPEKAIEGIRHSPHIRDELKMTKAVLASWAGKTPDKAAAWVQQHTPAGADREEMLATVAEQWARRDGAAAVALAVAERATITPKLAGNAAKNFAIEHPLPETTQFLRQFEDDAAFHAALGSAAASAFRGRIEEARDYVIENRRTDWQQPMLALLAAWEMRSFAETWSAAAAFDALDVAQLPAAAVQAAAENIALQLGYDDRVPAALDWTLHLPAAVAPEVRRTLVRKLSDAEQKQAASAWLSAAPLAEPERAALQRLRPAP